MKERVGRFLAIGALALDERPAEGPDERRRIRWAFAHKPPMSIPSHCLTAPIRIYHTYAHQCNLRCRSMLRHSCADYTERRMSLKEIELVMNKFTKWARWNGIHRRRGDLLSDFSWPSAGQRARHARQCSTPTVCWSDSLRNAARSRHRRSHRQLGGGEEINDQRRSRVSIKMGSRFSTGFPNTTAIIPTATYG